MRPSDKVHKFKPQTNNLRHLLDDNVLDDETRKALMKDIQGVKRPSIAVQPSTNNSSAQTGASPSTSSHPTSASRHRSSDCATSDADLLGVMAQRLRSLEMQSAMLQKELKEKSMRAIEFEDKYKAERQTRKTLEEENDDLRKQVTEMQQFLGDYGLTWVGGSARSSPSTTPRSSSAQPPPPHQGFDLYSGTFSEPAISDASPNDPPSALESTGKPSAGGAPSVGRRLPFDLALLQRNADILSAHVGVTGVVGSGDAQHMRMIKERDKVYVCVYADGICVNSGPFRPYGWPLCEAIIGDMLEGFYPYEFRDKYPDGFPIVVIDKSTEVCPTGSAAAKAGVRGMSDVNDHGYKPLDRAGLLKKLPEKYVTANGHLIDVRESMAKVLSGGTAATADNKMSTITGSTAAHLQVAHQQDGSQVSVASSSSNITAVLVKLPNGQKVVLHMYFYDTIARVREELHKAAPGFADTIPRGGSYEFATVFPRKTYDDHHQSLEHLGLVPNCTLMIKIV